MFQELGNPTDLGIDLDDFARRGAEAQESGDSAAQFAILDELRPLRQEFIRQQRAAQENGENGRAAELTELLSDIDTVASMDVMGMRSSSTEVWWSNENEKMSGGWLGT